MTMQRRIVSIAVVLSLGLMAPVAGALASEPCHACCPHAMEAPCAPEGPPCNSLAAAGCCDVSPESPSATAPNGAEVAKPLCVPAPAPPSALSATTQALVDPGHTPAGLRSPRCLSVVRRL